MKVTVIGFWGGYPGKGEATSGYLVESDDYKVLVDCGSGVVAQLQYYVNPEDLDAVLISHYHNDHVCDIGALQYARLIKGYLGHQMFPLPIYGHAENEVEFMKLTYENVTTVTAYDPRKQLTLGPFTISFLKTKHPVTCYAMKIQTESATIIYTADTSYLEQLELFSTNADLLICECNLYEGMDGEKAGHMTSTHAGLLAQKSDVKQLLLTHLPHFGDHNELIQQAQKEYLGPISLAKSGWEWSKQKG
ncbi:MBL fold metallo-hydrolase [Bacillus sp. DJP31]|uniref:MBL fold metallo-hydrolase n=1 Tax=Bacillus sp. DJP31 TaxID=3409789 RepID=UPI003BB5CAF2